MRFSGSVCLQPQVFPHFCSVSLGFGETFTHPLTAAGPAYMLLSACAFIPQVLEDVLKEGVFIAAKVNDWTTQIVEQSLKRLASLKMDLKYAGWCCSSP